MKSVSLRAKVGVPRARRAAAWLLIGIGVVGCSQHVSLGDLRGVGSSAGRLSTVLEDGGNNGRGGAGMLGISPGGVNGGAQGSSDKAPAGKVETSPDGNRVAESEAGAGGEGALCPTQACVASAPTGWFGPVAFWEGQAGALETLPDCPPGYADPIDLHRELDAPASACTCTCTAQGQVCDGYTSLTIFVDAACQSKCATTAPQACDVVPGCSGSQGSVRADVPKPSAGFCQATVIPPVPAGWQYDVRLCQVDNPGSCEDPRQTCAPVAASPYLTPLCVMRIVSAGQALPVCPTGYPNALGPLYGSFSDSRGCSECGCSDVTGGSCSGTLMLSNSSDCGSGISYPLASGCTPFDLGSGNSLHLARQYALERGVCSVAGAAHPTGSAAPDGPVTALCCQ